MADRAHLRRGGNAPWIDADDQEQLKRITDMTELMAREGLLIRTGRGVYKLRDNLVSALSRALHPITDYRVAARLGMPVPERPPLRLGRSGIAPHLPTSEPPNPGSESERRASRRDSNFPAPPALSPRVNDVA